MEVRTIVVPIDFQVGSDAALAKAKALATDLGSRLVLVHVAPVSHAAFPVIVGIDAHRVVEAARESLKKMGLPLVEQGLEVDFAVRRGGAAAEIVAFAAEVDADLIVMGTHGRGPVAQAFLGSVAQNVVRGAGCPVLTVRATED